jgi:hypothetical protein
LRSSVCMPLSYTRKTMWAEDKHSSLFVWIIKDEEKSFVRPTLSH